MAGGEIKRRERRARLVQSDGDAAGLPEESGGQKKCKKGEEEGCNGAGC